MKIEKISFVGEGYTYFSSDTFNMFCRIPENVEFVFKTGVNKIIGDIDSAAWALSYILSMYNHRPKDINLFGELENKGSGSILVNDNRISLKDFGEYSCYLDFIYPLFSDKSKHITLKKIIEKGLEKNHCTECAEEIRDLFGFDEARFTRPLYQIHSYRYRAFAAIGYVYQKQVYCLPWVSDDMYENQGDMKFAIEKLEALGKIIILPKGYKHVSRKYWKIREVI